MFEIPLRSTHKAFFRIFGALNDSKAIDELNIFVVILDYYLADRVAANPKNLL